jgi:serine protease Do
MKRKALLSLVLALGGASAARAQDAPPEPARAPAPAVGFATTFLDGGNFLGVHPEEVTRENASRYNLTGEPRGVGVREVVKGGPAEKAGLRAGDVILRFDGEEVTSVRKLNRLIDEAAPEHSARLTILRGGAQQEVAATLGKDRGLAPALSGFGTFDADAARRMAEELKRNSEQWQFKGEEWGKRLEELQRANPGGLFAVAGGRRIGVSVEPLGKQLADYFGVPNGVLIQSVEPGSPADKAGLKAGDVITEADGEKVSDRGDLPRLLGRKQEGEVTLTVVRERKSRTVRVTPEKRGATFVGPGEFRLVTPGAVVVAPPAPVIAPRAPRAPRVRPVAPRAWAWGRGRAI